MRDVMPDAHDFRDLDPAGKFLGVNAYKLPRLTRTEEARACFVTRRGRDRSAAGSGGHAADISAGSRGLSRLSEQLGQVRTMRVAPRIDVSGALARTVADDRAHDRRHWHVGPMLAQYRAVCGQARQAITGNSVRLAT